VTANDPPKKWVGLVDRARRDKREGPNLIVYHGKRRWELNLQSGRLKVTHGASSVDVTQYHRALLPGEAEPVQADEPEDVVDDEAFFDRHEGRRVLVAHRERERERDQALVRKARRWAAAQPLTS